jgi:RES domain-containing protein
MRLWRISNHLDLSGDGGFIVEGRWHRRGISVVYATDHPATAMLETLAHFDVRRIPDEYQLLGIDVPTDAPQHRLDPTVLPSGWRNNLELTQSLGMELLERKEHLLVFVPTVLVPMAWNVLLNPTHGAAEACKIAEVIREAFDPRLICFPRL